MTTTSTHKVSHIIDEDGLELGTIETIAHDSKLGTFFTYTARSFDPGRIEDEVDVTVCGTYDNAVWFLTEGR